MTVSKHNGAVMAGCGALSKATVVTVQYSHFSGAVIRSRIENFIFNIWIRNVQSSVTIP